jgi:hypothetical protein
LTHGQDTIVIQKSDRLISGKAFSNLVLQDFNFLVLDDLSPTQGVSTNIKEDGSQILLSGILMNKANRTLTVNANLISTDGIYFFDNEAGGKKAGVTLNYFDQYFSYYTFSHSQENLISLRMKNLDLIINAKHRLDSIFYNLVRHIQPDSTVVIQGRQNSFKELGIDFKKSDSTITIKELVHRSKLYQQLNRKLLELCSEYINRDTKLSYHLIKEKKYIPSIKDTLQVVIKTKSNEKIPITYSATFKKLWRRYLSHCEYIKSALEQEIINSEIKNSKSLWDSKHLFFYSLHPYYTRENVVVFSNNEFTDNIGDLYGLRFNFLNYSYERLQGIKMRSLLRLGMSAGRISNRTGSPISLTSTTVSGSDGDGNPLTSTTTRSAYNNISRYDYGNRIGLHAEFYVYPNSGPLGFFGTITWRESRFPDETQPDYIKEIPFRAGILYNLRNQKKKKDIIVAQLFIDRSDLNLNPTSSDDWRFGFGVGLPITF